MNYRFSYSHNGNQYLIDLDREKFDHLHFSVFSITLDFISKNNEFNLLHLSRFIGQNISEVFRDDEECIIFFISDTTAIIMNEERNLSPQEYRHELFKKMISLSKIDVSYSELIINNDTFLTTVCLRGKEANQRLVETEIIGLAEKNHK